MEPIWATALTQHVLRHKIEQTLRKMKANIHGVGTNLTTGVMDISFDVEGRAYRLDLRRMERNDR